MSKQSSSGVAFLSTHPSSSQRIAAMRQNLPAAMQVYNQRR
jgi:Zn-dependent protease with chaperone function